MKLLIAWAGIDVLLCIVMELFLAKESLSHGKAALRTRDVSFDTGSFTSSDILALVVTAVSDYFDLLDFQDFFGSRSRWRQQSEIGASIGHFLLNDELVLGIDGHLRIVTDTNFWIQGHRAAVWIGQ